MGAKKPLMGIHEVAESLSSVAAVEGDSGPEAQLRRAHENHLRASRQMRFEESKQRESFESGTWDGNSARESE